MKRIPVVLDTDIGGDIDDTWALAMLLKSPELDTTLITSATGNTTYRAKIVARMLEVAGRTDIPIGIGIHQNNQTDAQEKWVEQYDLARFPGTVHKDGVDALIQTIMNSREPVTLLAIGPLTNIVAAIDREPELPGRTRFVGMFGSIRRHKEGRNGAIAEYNVVMDIKAAQRVFSAPWQSMTVTPVDTCGQVRLKGDRYRRVRDANDPLLRAVIENYRLWAPTRTGYDAELFSSILFDTVAVYLAFTTEHLAMKRMGVRVRDDGFMVEDASARSIDVALDWQYQDAFEEFLVERLLVPTCR